MNDQNKDEEEVKLGLAAVIAVPAMILCCAALLLGGGAISGFLAWLSDGGAVTIGLAAVAGAVGVYLYKTKVARKSEDQAVEATPPDN